MIAITTNSSTRVKPFEPLFIVRYLSRLKNAVTLICQASLLPTTGRILVEVWRVKAKKR